MNQNTSRRLGRHRRSVVTGRVESRNPHSKQLQVSHPVTGPGVRGRAVNSSAERKAAGKSPWLLNLRNEQRQRRQDARRNRG